MNHFRLFLLFVALTVPLSGTGCFRVGSDTRALRDAALDSGFGQVEEKIEIGVGFFTVGLARFVTQYVDVPPEAKSALGSLRHAECAVYEVHRREHSLASILADADRAMELRGCERLVGVIQDAQLVAVYVPRSMKSSKDVQASVLVLNHNQLVCASARADATQLMDLAMAKLNEHKAPKAVAIDL